MVEKEKNRQNKSYAWASVDVLARRIASWRRSASARATSCASTGTDARLCVGGREGVGGPTALRNCLRPGQFFGGSPKAGKLFFWFSFEFSQQKETLNKSAKERIPFVPFP